MWRRVASSTFERCPYTKAIAILQEALKNGKVFDPKDPEKQKVEWGVDMASVSPHALAFVRPRMVVVKPVGS